MPVNTVPRPQAAELRTASGIAGLSIAVHRRQGQVRTGSTPVLFVHGATFPSALAADFPFGDRPVPADASGIGDRPVPADASGIGDRPVWRRCASRRSLRDSADASGIGDRPVWRRCASRRSLRDSADASSIGGRSWMETLAARGHDVWALDFLGYGRSDRYPQMGTANAEGAPLGDASGATPQISSAVELIRNITSAPRVAIVAHSWGCTAAACFTAANPEIVGRFVMFAPVVPRTGPRERAREQRFWDISADYQRRRFASLVPAGGSPLIEPTDLEPWLETYVASDPTSTQRMPPSARVPYGPTADIDRLWNGIALFDPGEIRVPTLIVYGEWDVTTTTEDALRLYNALTHAPVRQLTLLDRGTHVMHLERSRGRLYAAVAAFLEMETA